MKGIEVYLILSEDNKDVCYLEYKEIEDFKHYLDGSMMITTYGGRYGLVVEGAIEDKDLLTVKLLEDYKKTLKKEEQELKKKIKLFNKIYEMN